MKNLICVGIIAVCLVVAGLVFFGGGSDEGLDSISDEDQIWTICMECKNTQQMGKKQYYEDLREKSAELANPMATPYVTCEKCGKDAVTKAIKCEKCGEVFREGAVKGDYPDKCPKCKYSPVETRYKERTGN